MANVKEFIRNKQNLPEDELLRIKVLRYGNCLLRTLDIQLLFSLK